VDHAQALEVEVVVDGQRRFSGDLKMESPVIIPISQSERQIEILCDGILQHVTSPAPNPTSRFTLIGLRVGNEAGWLPPDHWRLRRYEFAVDESD